MSGILYLSDPLRRRILAALEEAYPDEGCGLLIGRRGADGGIEADEIAPSANKAADRRHAFEVDPALILAWHKRLRGTAREIVGVYHSHPDGPAEPSPRDLARAWDPALVWLIAAVGPDGAGDLAAFEPAPDGGGFRPLALAGRA